MLSINRSAKSRKDARKCDLRGSNDLKEVAALTNMAQMVEHQTAHSIPG